MACITCTCRPLHPSGVCSEQLRAQGYTPSVQYVTAYEYKGKVRLPGKLNVCRCLAQFHRGCVPAPNHAANLVCVHWFTSTYAGS